MAFQVSPGVLVQEKDLTRIIPAVSTSIGAFAGEFRKGPIDEITTISSEQELVSVFGKPDASNYEDFFSAANFLQYSNALRVFVHRTLQYQMLPKVVVHLLLKT